MFQLSPHDQRAAVALATIPFTNPFLKERVNLERRVLGADYPEIGPVLRARPGAREEAGQTHVFPKSFQVKVLRQHRRGSTNPKIFGS